MVFRTPTVKRKQHTGAGLCGGFAVIGFGSAAITI